MAVMCIALLSCANAANQSSDSGSDPVPAAPVDEFPATYHADWMQDSDGKNTGAKYIVYSKKEVSPLTNKKLPDDVKFDEIIFYADKVYYKGTLNTEQIDFMGKNDDSKDVLICGYFKDTSTQDVDNLKDRLLTLFMTYPNDVFNNEGEYTKFCEKYNFVESVW